MLNYTGRQGGARAAALVLWLGASVSWGQTETISGQFVGADTRLVFTNTLVPGATGIDFSFDGGVSPTYPDTETHMLITDFEWGLTASGPWWVSPDNANSIPGGITSFISTGVYHGPEERPFVALHFYAGDFMVVSGTFTHASVIPEPSVLALLGFVAAGFLVRRWQAAH